MSTPPPFPGQPAPWGQPPGRPPLGPPTPGGSPPQRGGIPVWAWVVGAVALVLVLCLCGGVGVVVATSDESTAAGPVTTGPATPPTSDPTVSSTSEPTTTTSSPFSTTEPSSASSSSPLTFAPPSGPPTPAGSTANTDTSVTLPAHDVQKRAAKQLGYEASEVSCPSDLVLVAGRSVDCTAPATKEGAAGDATVTAKVLWSAKIDSDSYRYYLYYQRHQSSRPT